MIAAVILAAGSSTRMGLNDATGQVPSKALLPLGSTTVIERVVEAARTAGVDEAVVVTGHAADRMTPVLERLGVRSVHNAGHRAGMFSSVLAGVRALGPEVDAFFVLPVDYALIRPGVMAELIRHRAGAGPGCNLILHPTCCGRRGHPPLIAGCLRDELLGVGNDGSLRAFLAEHEPSEADVEVQDLTILMDMDTPDDYRRLARFARSIDDPVTAGLSPADSRYLRALLLPPDHLVAHSEIVAELGLAIARAVREHVPTLDVELVYSACLLHDLAKGTRKHPVIGRQLLQGLGLSRLAEIVGAHMVMPPELLDLPHLTEDQVVYLADKLVVGDHVVGLAGKTAHTVEKHAGNPEGIESAKARMHTATVIARRVESFLGRRLEDVILEARAGTPSEPAKA